MGASGIDGMSKAEAACRGRSKAHVKNRLNFSIANESSNDVVIRSRGRKVVSDVLVAAMAA